jgi:hypothetical protein
MKIHGMRLFPNHAGAIVAVAYAYGAVLGCLSLLWSRAVGRGMPQLEWWQYLLAPLAIGAVAFVLEAVGSFIANGFTSGQTASSARLTAGKVALIALLVLLLVGWPMFQIAQL